MTKELIEEAREFLQSENAQYYDSSLIKALADALEDQLAARQPTEDDREAITGNELADAVSVYHVACGKPANSEGVRAVLALSRAAVPDATTESDAEALENALDDVARQRDAALAVVERVRAALSAWEMVQARNREYLESGNPGMIVPIDCTGGLRAALDGAPEPEGLPVEGEKR